MMKALLSGAWVLGLKKNPRPPGLLPLLFLLTLAATAEAQFAYEFINNTGNYSGVCLT
ncbi:MAG: hypothetical protein ACLQVX_25195 [Limisphaerales bacterium]